ncbi:MAG: hypothetical protein QOE70_1095 [Chthoniobacter sp.]|jgi:hypothetical protein|nr:hypothetical protein [Chthoniobacter sp.]
MRILFVVIVLAAIGYLAWEFTLAPKAPLPTEAASPAAAGPAAEVPGTPEGVAPPPAPRRKEPAPGIFYVTERVTVQTEIGVKALWPGEEVQLLLRQRDGTMKVLSGKHEFVVKPSQLTGDPNDAALPVAPRK